MDGIVRQWLIEFGEAIRPYLKHDFNYSTKIVWPGRPLRQNLHGRLVYLYGNYECLVVVQEHSLFFNWDDVGYKGSTVRIETYEVTLSDYLHYSSCAAVIDLGNPMAFEQIAGVLDKFADGVDCISSPTRIDDVGRRLERFREWTCTNKE